MCPSSEPSSAYLAEAYRGVESGVLSDHPKQEQLGHMLVSTDTLHPVRGGYTTPGEGGAHHTR